MGSVQGALRWNTLILAARPAMAGTSWMALAPVPITPIRLASTDSSESQRAVCKAVPAKLSAPGRAGTLGRLSCPTAGTRTSATTSPPSAVRTRHLPAVASHSAPVTSVWNRTSGVIPRSSAVRWR